MKIVIIVVLFPPKWLAGTEIATYDLACHLARRGHEVHVITSHDGDLPDLSEENGFYIHRTGVPETQVISILSFWVKAYLQINKIKPEVVLSQSLQCGIPALMAKRFLKIPYAVWGQGSDIYLPDRLIRMFSKPILKSADAALALTDNMRREMQQTYTREIFVVPNGIDLKRVIPPSGIEKGGNKKTILFVGRLHPVKGVRYLIESMAVIHRKMPCSNLIIVGDGEDRQELEELAKNLGLEDHVHFSGQVPQDRVHLYMHQADVFVLPSLSEGFGIVNIEAMAAGLPIVATNVGGIPDIIEEGVNGYLVNAKSSDELSDRILMLLQNDTLRAEIAANNRVKAKMFSWDAIAGIVEEVYQEIVARK